MPPFIRTFTAALLSIVPAIPANAEILSFDIAWSGEPFGNTATATGRIVVDSMLAPAIGSTTYTIPSAAILALEITIIGAASGNGSFDLSNFPEVYFWTPSALDLTTELVGQTLDNGCSFGFTLGDCLGSSGDFNVSGFGAPDPNGNGYFILQANYIFGDNLAVTSIRPTQPIPEPATWAMMIAGFGLVGQKLRRRRRNPILQPISMAG